MSSLLDPRPGSEETKDKVKTDLGKGIKAVTRLCVCTPFAAGADFTLADLYAYDCFGLPGTLATQVVGIDLLGEQPQIEQRLERLAKVASIVGVAAETRG